MKKMLLTGAVAALGLAPVVPALHAAPAKPAPKPAAKPAPKPGAPGMKMAPLKVDLPKPMFLGTPKNIAANPHLEKFDPKPRPAFMAPVGATNVAKGKPVTSSDSNPINGTLDMITDSSKEGTEGNWVELGPGTQWVQVDLKGDYKLYAIVLWHYHAEARIYHDVVVQVADDPDFTTGVKTIFNNDFDNSIGQGLGKNLEYFEKNEGKLMAANGVKGRYVRCYSAGNTSDSQNHYTEVEIYGLPAK